MNRPDFKNFAPKDANVLIINDLFLNSPELYKYIQALDTYIDFLEEPNEKTQRLIKSLLKRNINQELKELLAFELEVIK